MSETKEAAELDIALITAEAYSATRGIGARFWAEESPRFQDRVMSIVKAVVRDPRVAVWNVRHEDSASLRSEVARLTGDAEWLRSTKDEVTREMDKARAEVARLTKERDRYEVSAADYRKLYEYEKARVGGAEAIRDEADAKAHALRIQRDALLKACEQMLCVECGGRVGGRRGTSANHCACDSIRAAIAATKEGA
jgi:hypothetical protein